LGWFHWRPPNVKQELSVPQAFQRLQFAVDMQAGRADWNDTALATEVKFPAYVMIWTAIGANHKLGCGFCSHWFVNPSIQGCLSGD
jgi:hypothetical protein